MGIDFALLQRCSLSRSQKDKKEEKIKMIK